MAGLMKTALSMRTPPMSDDVPGSGGVGAPAPEPALNPQRPPGSTTPSPDGEGSLPRPSPPPPPKLPPTLDVPPQRPPGRTPPEDGFPPPPGGPGGPPAPGGGQPGTQGYTPATWTPTTRTVQSNETVADQLDRILAADSPLLQRARMRSAQQMNDRGLMNSTMAMQAGEAAAIDAALPIAQQDANTYRQTSAENQAIVNQAGQFNAAQGTDAARFVAAGDLQMQTQRLASQLDTASRERVMAIEQNYRHLTNNSAAANQLVQTMNGQIGSILADPQMTPENKQTMIQRLIENTNFALRMMGNINGINFGNLLNFGGGASPAPAPVAPTPSPGSPFTGTIPNITPPAPPPSGGWARLAQPLLPSGINSPVPTSPSPGTGYRWIPGQGWVYSPQG